MYLLIMLGESTGYTGWMELKVARSSAARQEGGPEEWAADWGVKYSRPALKRTCG